MIVGPERNVVEVVDYDFMKTVRQDLVSTCATFVIQTSD